MIEQDQTDLWELWLGHLANCGDAQIFEFDAYLHEAYILRAMDLEILAITLEDLELPRQPRGR